MTRTTIEAFAPAIANANKLNYLHKRIQGCDQRGLLIESMFRSGRITGCEKALLLDVYDSDA